MRKKRKDSRGRILMTGEAQRENGSYSYRWTDRFGDRQVVYAPNLNELRMLKENIKKTSQNGLLLRADNITVNDMYKIWVKVKKGVKENTFENYKYMYEKFSMNSIGKYKISTLRKLDIRIFYNELVDEQGLKIRTLDTIHTVLYQILELAVEENYIGANPSNNALNELSRAHRLNSHKEKKKALTLDEQKALLKYLDQDRYGKRLKPIVIIMLYTGLRVGEITGLTWDDIDFENNTLSVKRTLTYFKQKDGKFRRRINTPKSPSSYRTIPMLNVVREAFIQERKFIEAEQVPMNTIIDGVGNFIFINLKGNVKLQSTINQSLRRLIKKYNEKVNNDSQIEDKMILLPQISCHTLRHTFATRQVEANVNLKVVQQSLGHSSIETTMDIYVEATEELKVNEFQKMENYLNDFDII